jgi:dolichol-phosphate mannosyltransferase
MSVSDKVLIMVATYNERENLEGLVLQIQSLEIATDILIIDDNSPDGTGHLADALAARMANIHVMHRPRKHGLAFALMAGFNWAVVKGYGKVVNIDADFSHNPVEIPSLLKSSEKSDLVIGSRYVNGVRVMNWDPKRLLLSLLAAQYVRLITGMPIQDPTSGFRCFSLRALKTLKLKSIHSKGYFFHVESLYSVWRRGLSVMEYPIVFQDRVKGVTKISQQIIVEAILRCFFLRFSRRSSESTLESKDKSITVNNDQYAPS